MASLPAVPAPVLSPVAAVPVVLPGEVPTVSTGLPKMPVQMVAPQSIPPILLEEEEESAAPAPVVAVSVVAVSVAAVPVAAVPVAAVPVAAVPVAAARESSSPAAVSVPDVPAAPPEAPLIPDQPAPASAGTRDLRGQARLEVIACDPHRLYAHWDLPSDPDPAWGWGMAGGALTLRAFECPPGGTPSCTAWVPPDIGSWFLHVGRGGRSWLVELGVQPEGGVWRLIARAEVVETPPEGPMPLPEAALPASAGTVSAPVLQAAGGLEPPERFVAVPVDHPFGERLAGAGSTDMGVSEMVRSPEERGAGPLPDLIEAWSAPTPSWSREQEQAMACLRQGFGGPPSPVASVNLAESPVAVERPNPTSSVSPLRRVGEGPPAGSSDNTITPVEERPRRFWFKVNAELVIYGATEPDARLTIAGRPVTLRPDGSFSLRFALPDGDYELPMVALAAAGDQSRAADLQFGRRSVYFGIVGAQAQNPELCNPRTKPASV